MPLGPPATAQPNPPAVPSALTVAQANLIVARLGGFWGRKGDGHPGAESLARGLELLAALVHYCEITGQTPQRPSTSSKRPRKPG